MRHFLKSKASFTVNTKRKGYVKGVVSGLAFALKLTLKLDPFKRTIVRLQDYVGLGVVLN